MYLCTVKCNISYEIYTKDVQENGKNYIHEDELKYMKKKWRYHIFKHKNELQVI